MHRRVDVAKGPFVGGQLAAGMQIALMEHQQQLLLGKFAIDQRHRNAMESQVPGSVPGVLPLVWHGDNVGVVQMRPLVVAPTQPLGRRRRPCRIAFEPPIHFVGIELLTPQESAQRLAHDVAGVA